MARPLRSRVLLRPMAVTIPAGSANLTPTMPTVSTIRRYLRITLGRPGEVGRGASDELGGQGHRSNGGLRVGEPLDDELGGDLAHPVLVADHHADGRPVQSREVDVVAAHQRQ